MRKLIVEAEVSIDGAMGGENMNFWQQNYPLHSAGVQEYLDDLLFMPDALLMGQKTYEFFAQVWPTRQGKDADRINSFCQQHCLTKIFLCQSSFIFLSPASKDAAPRRQECR